MSTIRTWIEPSKSKYRVRYRDASKKKRDIWPISRFDSRSEAKQAKKHWEETQLKKALGKVDIETDLQALFDQWLLDCLTGIGSKSGKPKKPATILCFKDSLKYVLEHCQRLGQIDSEWVKHHYLPYLVEKYEPWTVHRRLVDLKSFVSYLRRLKVMSWDPFEGVIISRPTSKPRFYSDEEIDGFERACLEQKSLWTLLYIRLGYCCGFRHSEAANLELYRIRRHPTQPGWGLIDLSEAETKTEYSRLVGAPPKVMDLLVQLCGKRTQGTVFRDWTDFQFSYGWNRMVAASGLKPSDWYVGKFKWASEALQDRGQTPYHGLRHTFCRRFIENGGDISELKELTGHKSVEVLMKTYAHFGKKHILDRQIAAYEMVEARPKFGGQLGGKLAEIIETSGNNLEHTVTSIGQVKQTEQIDNLEKSEIH